MVNCFYFYYILTYFNPFSFYNLLHNLVLLIYFQLSAGYAIASANKNWKHSQKRFCTDEFNSNLKKNILMIYFENEIIFIC